MPKCPMCLYDPEQATDDAPIETRLYDLETLERAHEVWEMYAKTERAFDTWLHAQIMRAKTALTKL